MAEPKTKPTAADPAAFLAAVPDERRRADAEALCALMAEVTGAPPVMWGSSIVGFGTYHYRGASGRSGDWPPVGFSPRKQALTLYVAEGFEPHQDLLARLGPHTTGKGCLYVKRLDALDETALRELIERGFAAYDGKTISS
ncbi:MULTISPECIES: DUF1801 domain-containing protein [unclassified Kitasatospora]|uniref:DUF1801 domain-containing protein n=1 Tax=unclassified Kitasatospora TaxID=2633591 RepID=UPI00070A49A0|nr:MULTISPECIES: DUF1801 domain-containing protein [unclassified Kitasatospora]KQV18506.1 hypothetical protein ASC99_04550 [Kitasatospora sp. Root107]KRB74490.1 hypothetical protein ASE03_18470 [Kitasatospora sp. Root187]